RAPPFGPARPRHRAHGHRLDHGHGLSSPGAPQRRARERRRSRAASVGTGGCAMTAIAVRAPLRVGVSRSRRVKDRAFSVFIWVAAVLALLPLGFIAGYVIAKGVKALNVDFFTKAPVPPPLTGGGFGPAFVGSA